MQWIIVRRAYQTALAVQRFLPAEPRCVAFRQGRALISLPASASCSSIMRRRSRTVRCRYAEEVLEGWVATRERLQGESQVKGTVTIVAPCEAHEALLVSLLSRLGKRWKDLRVLTSLAAPADAAKMIRSGAADVGILPARMYEGLNVRPLCRARLCAAVATRGAWASRKSIPVNPGPSAQLLISNPQASALCDLLKQRPSGSSGRKMRFGSWGGGRSTLLEAVAAQLGIGWFLFFEEYGDPLARQLPTGVLLKPVSGIPARIPFCLAIRKGRRPGGAVEFVLREVLRHFRR